MKNLKNLAVASAVVALSGSAYAIPTLTISDGVGAPVTVVNASGIVLESFSDAFWTVVISTGETKPVFGNAPSPMMDLNIQATSAAGNTHNLTVTFSDDLFGPTSGRFGVQLSGHVTNPQGGPGATVTYNTFYSAANTIPATTALTASGSINDVAGGCSYTGTSGAFSQSSYSLSQVVTVGATPSASYSLDASLVTVPD